MIIAQNNLRWLFVHIFYLIGFKNRLLVFIQWFWSYMTLGRGARLITSRNWKPERRVDLAARYVTAFEKAMATRRAAAKADARAIAKKKNTRKKLTKKKIVKKQNVRKSR